MGNIDKIIMGQMKVLMVVRKEELEDCEIHKIDLKYTDTIQDGIILRRVRKTNEK